MFFLLKTLLVIRFEFRQVLLDLRIAIDHVLLFLFKLNDLFLSLADFENLVLLLVVDHDVLALKQFEVTLQILFAPVSLLLLGVQVLNLTH